MNSEVSHAMFMRLKSAAIVIFKFSVETQGEVETLYILTKFTQEYDNNRGILQICLYLPKLRLRVKCIGFFLRHE